MSAQVNKDAACSAAGMHTLLQYCHPAHATLQSRTVEVVSHLTGFFGCSKHFFRRVCRAVPRSSDDAADQCICVRPRTLP